MSDKEGKKSKTADLRILEFSTCIDNYQFLQYRYPVEEF